MQATDVGAHHCIMLFCDGYFIDCLKFPLSGAHSSFTAAFKWQQVSAVAVLVESLVFVNR